MLRRLRWKTLSEGDLIIGLPDVEKTPVRVEKNANGQYYFAINDYQASSYAPKTRKARPPKQITLFWDASGSRGNKDHKHELMLLQALFTQWTRKP